MSEVGVFGSSALAIVHAADTEIRARGGRLIVRGARPEVAELLAVVGIPGAPHAEPASPARLDVLAPVR